MSESVRTGIILPRGYGVSYWNEKSRRREFAEPLTFARAVANLVSEEDIRRALKEENIFDKFKSKLSKGNLESFLGRSFSDIFSNIEVNDAILKGKVKSNSRSRKSHEFKIHKDRQSSCKCEDFDNNFEKLKGVYFCIHTATVLAALDYDNWSGNSRADSALQLYKSDREGFSSSPFTLFDHGLINPSIMRGIWTYVVLKKTRVDANEYLLRQKEIYPKDLWKKFKKGKVRFSVLRQQEKIIKNPTPSQKRFCDSRRHLTQLLIGEIRGKNYERSGYALEFKGTPYQATSIILKPKFRSNHEYRVVTPENLPPFIISKTSSQDDFTGSLDSSHLLSENPLRIKKRLVEVDDCTRIKATAEIIVPGQDKKGRILTPVSQVMQRAYDIALEQVF